MEREEPKKKEKQKREKEYFKKIKSDLFVFIPEEMKREKRKIIQKRKLVDKKRREEMMLNNFVVCKKRESQEKDAKEGLSALSAVLKEEEDKPSILDVFYEKNLLCLAPHASLPSSPVYLESTKERASFILRMLYLCSRIDYNCYLISQEIMKDKEEMILLKNKRFKDGFREIEKSWKSVFEFLDELVCQLNCICDEKESGLTERLKEGGKCCKDEIDENGFVLPLRNIRVSLLFSLSFLASLKSFIDSQSYSALSFYYKFMPEDSLSLIRSFIDSLRIYLNSCYQYPFEMKKAFEQNANTNNKKGVCTMMCIKIVITGLDESKRKINCIIKREIVTIGKERNETGTGKEEEKERELERFITFHRFVKKIMEDIKERNDEEESVIESEKAPSSSEEQQAISRENNLYSSFSLCLLPYVQFYSTVYSQTDLLAFLSSLIDGQTHKNPSLPLFSFSNEFFTVLDVDEITLDYLSSSNRFKEHCSSARVYYKKEVKGKVKEFVMISDIQFIKDKRIKEEGCYDSQRTEEDIDFNEFNRIK